LTDLDQPSQLGGDGLFLRPANSKIFLKKLPRFILY
jgi:hypothetical protein